MNIREVTVLGAGQMGCGIAQTFAQHGWKVGLYDIDEAAVARGITGIQGSLSRFIRKGSLTEEEKDRILHEIHPSTDLAIASCSELVIEAVPEQMDLKISLFKQLDHICAPHTIFATNTSSLSITAMASATRRPEQVIGMHFMNPVPIMPLVEVIRGLTTSDATFEQIQMITQQLGKIGVEVQDAPGFVSNRILMPMINEAIYAVYEGVAAPEAVDQVMKLGMHHPMGPLSLADFIGLDTCLAIMETLHQGFSDSKYRPCPLLRKYVSAGWLGRKTGRGFFVYDE